MAKTATTRSARLRPAGSTRQGAGTGKGDPNVITTTLPNGIPVLFEPMENLRSVTIAVWALIGSRHEVPKEYGIAHVVEHMIFKGTKRRTAREIAESLEFIGGESNAFTSREYSCYYAKVANTDWPLAVDVLSDIVSESVFDAGELEKERKVILEEISMYEDNPEEVSHENLVAQIFDERLGHPIIGTREIITKMPRDTVARFYHDYYHPKNLFVTVVGNLTHEQFEKGISTFWPDAGKRKGKLPVDGKTKFRKGERVIKKEIEQLHLCLGLPALPVVHEDRFVLHLINNYLGGGMSSRLFQEVREKLGMAYSIYSFVQAYRDIGFFGIYCGTSANRVDKVRKIVKSELDRVADKGLTAKRLGQLKRQVRGNFLLGLEKTGFRMNRLGVSHIYFGRTFAVDEVLEKIDAITNEDVLRVAGSIFREDFHSVAIVGPK